MVVDVTKQSRGFAQKTSLMDGAFPAAPGHLVNPKASQTVYINCFMFYYPAGTSGRTERNLVRWLAASFLMLVVEPSHS